MLQLQLLEAACNRDAAEQELIRLQSRPTLLQAVFEELQRVHKAELAALVVYNNIVDPTFMSLLQMTLQLVCIDADVVSPLRVVCLSNSTHTDI